MDSVNHTENAKKVTNHINTILANGGFNIKDWQPNKHLEEGQTEKKEIKVPQCKAEAKLLGVGWNCEMNVLNFNVEIEDASLYRSLVFRHLQLLILVVYCAYLFL